MANNVLLLMEGSSACTVWRAIDLSTGFEATAAEGNAALRALALLDQAGGTAPAVPTLYSQLYAQTPFTAAIPADEYFSGSVAMTVGFFGEGAAGGGGGGGGLPAGAATSAKQDSQTTLLTSLHNDQATALGQAAQLTELDNIDVSTAAAAASVASVDTKLTAQATAALQTTLNGLIGALTETAPTTDIASSGLNGRAQRIAQRLTTLIALFPAALGQALKAASFPVVMASDQGSQDVDQTASATLSAVNANPNSGVPTAGSTCTLTINPGLAVAAFHVSAGATGGNAVFQGTVNGTTWKTIVGAVFTNGGLASNSTVSLAAETIYFLPVSGYTQVRLSVSALSSGSAAVTARGSAASAIPAIGLGNALTSIGFGAIASDVGAGTGGPATQRVILDSASPAPGDLTASGAITIQNSNGSSGVGTAGSFVALTALSGISSIAVQVTGVYTGALTPQGSLDGTTWVTLNGYYVPNNNTCVNGTISSAATGIFVFPFADLAQFRIVANAAVTGTATVTLRASSGAAPVVIGQQLPLGTNSIGNIGTLGTITPGAGATNLGKAKGSGVGSTDVGVFCLAARRDVLTTSSAAGNYDETAVDQFGAQLVRQFERHARTFSSSFQVTPAASATDIVILPGNASTTVMVTRILLNGVQTTAGLAEVLLIKRSTANAGGTSSAGTAVSHNSADTAASSVPLIYTANPTTPGTAVGTVRRSYVAIPAATSVVNPFMEFSFGDKGKGIYLSGTAQGLAINLNGATITGGLLDITVEWIEY